MHHPQPEDGFAVQGSLGQRRVSLYAERITPIQLADALALLLQASTSLRLYQTDQQKALEEAVLARLLGRRTKDQKLSDDLKRDLAPLLTPAQRRALGQGNAVTIPFSALPPKTRAKAERYLQVRWAGVQSRVPSLEETRLDASRSFGLHIRPEPDMILGIDAFQENGRLIGF